MSKGEFNKIAKFETCDSNAHYGDVHLLKEENDKINWQTVSVISLV